MPGLLAILTHTPAWVYGLFALVAWSGVRALRPCTQVAWRMLLTPVIFMGWGVSSLFLRSPASPVLAGDWLIALVLGAGAGWATTRFEETPIDRRSGRVSLPGSAFPLIRNLVFFFSKYALGLAAALAPAAQAEVRLWNIAVSGASSGYFLGWMARLFKAYSRPTVRSD